MCEEKIDAINDNVGIFSKIGSVAYKLGPQQTINDSFDEASWLRSYDEGISPQDSHASEGHGHDSVTVL